MTQTSGSDRIPSPVSVVVCAFNGLGYTKLLLESLRRFSLFEHEIVVWSDGSTDGTAEWLDTQPGILWKHDPENRGICSAMNRAADLATRPYLFFPNTDHVLAPGWDEALLRRLGPRTVVSLSCIEPGIVPVAPIFHTVNLGGRCEEFDWAGFEAAAKRLARGEATPGVNYPFALARSLWREVGALDERFNPGPANDPDLFYRLHLAGAEMIRAEDCLAYHFSGKSSRMADEATRERREWREVTDRNERRFEEKWGERYRYTNGGLPDPGAEAKKRWFTGEFRPESPETARLRVVLDARLVREETDGIAAYIVGLMRALARLDREIDLHVLSNDPRVLARKVGPLRGMSCRIVRSRPGGGPSEAAELHRIVSDLRPDVFHGPAFSIPRGLPCAGVVTIHDVAFELHPDWYPPVFVEHMRQEVRSALAESPRVIAVSDCTRRDLVGRFGVRAEDVEVVLEAPDEHVRHRREGDLGVIPRGPFHEGAPYLLAVGMKQKRKNALGLLRAYTSLVRSGRSSGAGLLMTLAAQNEDPAFMEEARTGSAGLDLCLAGHLPDADIERAIAGAVALVYPSLYEGFGLPMLHAMQRGCPVVCGSDSALPEVAGDAAIPVPSGDEAALERAVERVLSEPDLRRDLSRRGIVRALGFSWDKAAGETLACYRAALRGHSARRGRIPAKDCPAPIQVPPLTTSDPGRPDRRPKRPPDSLRVAVDARMAIAPNTGTGRYTLEILRHLGRAADGRAEFVLIGPHSADELDLAGRSPVVQHVPAGPETLLNPAWEQFGSVAALAGCDVAFAPTGILSAARTCPGVAVIHDLGFLDRPGDFEPRLSAHLTRWVRRTCLSAERLIAVSEFTKGRIAEHYGVDPERIAVVHHGRPGDFGEKPNPASPPIILCVSAFEPNKNLLALVDAFGKSGIAGEARLVLAGREGRALGAVRARVGERNLDRAVEIETAADDGRLRELYRSATTFAYPSLYEGFGMPLVEAMSAGLPLIVSRIPACLEVAGDAAVFLDPGDSGAWAQALHDVVRDPERRRRLAAKSRRRRARFDWSTAAQLTWECLLSAVRR